MFFGIPRHLHELGVVAQHLEPPTFVFVGQDHALDALVVLRVAIVEAAVLLDRLVAGVLTSDRALHLVRHAVVPRPLKTIAVRSCDCSNVHRDGVLRVGCVSPYSLNVGIF